jgi:hypothetical protein
VVAQEGVTAYIQNLLGTIQDEMFASALDYRNTHITAVDTFEEFKELLETKGGFLAAHWDGTAATEEKIKELTKATIRCIVGSCGRSWEMYLDRRSFNRPRIVCKSLLKKIFFLF